MIGRFIRATYTNDPKVNVGVVLGTCHDDNMMYEIYWFGHTKIKTRLNKHRARSCAKWFDEWAEKR